MTLMKISWKSVVPSCCKNDKRLLASKKVSKQGSFQRLSLADLSDPSSLFSIDDLSNSFIGSNLQIFKVAQLRKITHSFSSCNFLGEGGFGPVYKGFIDDKLRPGLKAQPVAVKLLDLIGLQGHKEWLAEIIFLGQLRHPHLVKLIGYCWEDEHRLLVYEYMPRGSLENQLFRRYLATLPWSTRIKIAVGAARGLSFIHDADKPVIYRDFKTSNILLDSDYTAKLFDFGLAKDGPEGDDDTHISTQVMGTHGHAAPEYVVTGRLTTKSDVYSFGVVLSELLTGKRTVDKRRPGQEQNLVEWARHILINQRKLDRIMDPRLQGNYSGNGSQKAAALAYKCLSRHPKPRPTMIDAVKVLESLEHEKKQKMNHKDELMGPIVYIFSNEEKDGNEEEKDGIDDINGCYCYKRLLVMVIDGYRESDCRCCFHPIQIRIFTGKCKKSHKSSSVLVGKVNSFITLFISIIGLNMGQVLLQDKCTGYGAFFSGSGSSLRKFGVEFSRCDRKWIERAPTFLVHTMH